MTTEARQPGDESTQSDEVSQARRLDPPTTQEARNAIINMREQRGDEDSDFDEP
jgi:hypothetical protein